MNQFIFDKIIHYIKTSPDNSLCLPGHEKAWGKPVVGFSNAEDNLYAELKDIISPDYWHPGEIFELTYPGLKIETSQLNIICWVLPKTNNVKIDNRKEVHIPAEGWIRAKNYGVNCNKNLMRFVVSLLEKEGYKAVAPQLSEYYKSMQEGENGYYSLWSERYTAYICGLGTFGLCDGLITPVGKAVRIGSVITNAPMMPTKRNYASYNEYCLYSNNKSCFKCIERCPAGAITENGHDKAKCREYIKAMRPVYTKKYNLDFWEMACGLCQTKVPCESKIPVVK